MPSFFFILSFDVGCRKTFCISKHKSFADLSNVMFGQPTFIPSPIFCNCIALICDDRLRCSFSDYHPLMYNFPKRHRRRTSTIFFSYMASNTRISFLIKTAENGVNIWPLSSHVSLGPFLIKCNCRTQPAVR